MPQFYLTAVFLVSALPCLLAQEADLLHVAAIPNSNLTKEYFATKTDSKAVSIVFNFLGGIGSDAFVPLTKLNSVVIKQNDIKILPDHLDGLEKLTDFIFEDNEYKPQENVQKILIHLVKTNKNIEKLTVKRGYITNLEWILVDLLKLKRLDLSENWIQQLPDHLSTHLPNLKELILEFNNITVIDEDVFARFNKLEDLRLSHNNIVKIPHYAFKDLDGLKVLWFRNNSIAEISENTFIGLKSLVGLNIVENRLDLLPNNVFSHTSNLKYLTLKENTIESIENNAFHGLKELVELDLSNNYITEINGDMFKNLAKLNKLRLARNNIAVLRPKTISHMPELDNINLSYNLITQIDDEAFNDITVLEELDLSHNEIETWNPKAFKNINRIVRINLEENRIKTIQSLAFYNLGVKKLNFKNNSIKHIEFDGFKGLSDLEMLSLSGNRIAQFEEGTFSELHKLKCVDLMDNQVQTPELFHQLPDVKDVFSGKTWTNMDVLKTICYNK